MKSLPALIHDLKSVDEDSITYVRDFEQILSEIAKLPLSETVGPLLLCLSDSAPYDVAMFSIIHTIEMCEDELYISRILEQVEVLVVKSPGWTATLFMRILNSTDTRAELVRQIRRADAVTKQVVVQLIGEISRGDKEPPQNNLHN